MKITGTITHNADKTVYNIDQVVETPNQGFNLGPFAASIANVANPTGHDLVIAGVSFKGFPPAGPTKTNLDANLNGVKIDLAYTE